jgi:quercetin 2,3-dioxygenase
MRTQGPNRPPKGGIDVRRAASRFHTRRPWLDSWHSFSFGQHYDPSNTHFGLLLVSNDDTVAPATGFETHPHRDMEIVTWVLDGALVHQDSAGHSGTVYPGLAQRMSAGSGILHSEKNDAGRPVHFVQMWVTPDETGVEPGYEQLDIGAELDRGGLFPVASGRPGHDSAIRIRQRDAALHVARLRGAGSVRLPDAPYVHLFVAGGAVDVEAGGLLSAGDAARITDSGGTRVTATGAAELLVWEMHSAVAART